MPDYRTITVERDERGVFSVSLNRPEKHNAMNPELINELHNAFDSLAKDDKARVVVLGAQGKTFCAGGDLSWMTEQMKADRDAKKDGAQRLAAMLRTIDELPKLVIAKINGSAYGGGVGMAAVADIAIAVDGAKFSLTETRLGLIPAAVGPYVVRRLGEGNARQVYMNSKVFDAETARALGLLARVVSEKDLDNAVEEEVEEFLKCAPGAVAEAKAICLTYARENVENIEAFSANRLADRWETNEAMAGIKAFFEKKPPPWR